jgi:flagellar biosynthesis/type III secretory pathway chaperone
MIPVLENLIECLREELTQYGEMLALLDRQQETTVNRMTDELYAVTAAIQNQSRVIQETRARRDTAQRNLARELAVVEASSFVELTPLLPPHYRPLVESLVDENNDLLRKVQHRARQNHLLLRRSVELMQQFINSLAPAASVRTYTDRGARTGTPVSPPLYEAVG